MCYWISKYTFILFIALVNLEQSIKISTRNSKILTMVLLNLFLVIYYSRQSWLIFFLLLCFSLNLPDVSIKLFFFDFITILCSYQVKPGKNTEVNKQSVVMFWHSWRRYGSLYQEEFICQKTFSRKKFIMHPGLKKPYFAKSSNAILCNINSINSLSGSLLLRLCQIAIKMLKYFSRLFHHLRNWKA